MEDNKEMVATAENVENEVQNNEGATQPEVKVEKTFSRDELNKIIASERTKVLDEFKAQQNEAQKLAKMKEDERLQYEKEKVEKELTDLKNQLNAKNLKDEAVKIASEKDLPIQYLDLIDFSKESAESINEKIQNLVSARAKDRETYLNTKLKEQPPKQVAGATTKEDPFLQGFEKGWN